MIVHDEEILLMVASRHPEKVLRFFGECNNKVGIQVDEKTSYNTMDRVAKTMLNIGYRFQFYIDENSSDFKLVLEKNGVEIHSLVISDSKLRAAIMPLN